MASNNNNVPAVIEPPPAQPLNVLYVEKMAPQPRLFNYLLLICRIAVSLIIMLMIAVIFTVLMRVVSQPKFPHFRVSNATIHRIMISHDTIVALDCNMTVLITNTNSQVSAEYSKMEVSLLYSSQRVLLDQLYSNPFVQPPMNSNRIQTVFGMKDVYMESDVLGVLNKDVESGNLRLGMRMEGIVSWKKFAARSHFITVYCGSLVFRFSGSREVGVFESVGRECNVYLY